MSENRAAKSGIARDVQQKLAAKYDLECAAKCMRWVAERTGEPIDTSGDPEMVYKDLGDGHVLSKLMNMIVPGSIDKKLQTPQKMAFKKMEVIEQVTRGIKNLGVPDYCVFATCDLYEKANIGQVITCIEALARKINSIPGCPVEGFGPKEAEANKREFTQEQLNEGKSIIGLQMGSNKGANQSGQNFGKGRMIVD